MTTETLPRVVNPTKRIPCWDRVTDELNPAVPPESFVTLTDEGMAEIVQAIRFSEVGCLPVETIEISSVSPGDGYWTIIADRFMPDGSGPYQAVDLVPSYWIRKIKGR